jgi:ATP-binding cassette subfamily C protein
MLSLLRRINYLIGKSGRFKFLVLLVMMIINSLLEMVGVGVIPVFIITISDPDLILQHKLATPIIELLNITTSKNLVIWGFVFLAGLFIVKNAFFSMLIYIKNRITYNEQLRLGSRLFKSYMNARYPFFLDRNSAELLRNVNNETNIAVSGVVIPFLRIIMEGLVLLMIVILLLKVEPVITVLSFIALGTVSFIFIHITRIKNKAYGEEEQRQRVKMNKVVLEGISGIKEVKVLGRERNFLSHYNFSAVRTIIAQRYKQILNQLPKPLMEMTAVFMMLFIALMLMAMDRKASSFVPVLTLFGVATVRLLPALRTIVADYTDIRHNIYAIDPVYNDLKLLEEDASRWPENEKTKEAGIDPYPFFSEIALDNVSYCYPHGNAEAVRNISLKIPRGALIGFTGPSGAGKTTIVDILLGLLEPQQGRVSVDNQDIHENVRRWQVNLGYIPQFIHLSDDTIRKNIAFGLLDNEIDESKIKQALHAAQLESLIEELPEGLDTIVGERGVRLSGGQRQRVGIARALYNNPQVLIMDEATSALDNISERLVIEAIEGLKGDRTIVMIAHRLTTVRNCEVIYLINEGSILGQGNYDDLLKSSSAFRKMNLVER